MIGIVGLVNIALGVVDRAELMVTVGLALIGMGIVAGVGEISAPLFSLIVGLFMVGAAGAHRALR